MSVSVANLWKHPTTVSAKLDLPLLEKDIPLLKSQLLYGERVCVLQRYKDWIKVQTTEQLVSDDEGKTWRGLCGWIQQGQFVEVNSFPQYNMVVSAAWAPVYRDAQGNKKIDDLSVGTLLKSIEIVGTWSKVQLVSGLDGYIDLKHLYQFSSQEPPVQHHLSALLSKHARLFLDDPYCWSGRCAYCPDKCFITGIDCSGFVELAYRMFGFIVPRFAHYQYLKAVPIEPKSLSVGDLIFTKYKKDNWGRVTHVLMYLGNEMLIESTGKPGIEKVRIISFQDMFGVARTDAKNGERYNDKELHCGSFFSNKQDALQMRLRCISIDD